MTTYNITMTGTSPLLMHSAKASDPMSHEAKYIKELSALRNKSDADLIELSRREFLAALYVEDGQVVIPIDNVHSCLYSAAKRRKEGPIFAGGARVIRTDFQYDGPKDPQKLWEDERFRDRRSARVGTGRVMRTRPRFDEWKLVADILTDDDSVDFHLLCEWMRIAGNNIGLCDFRPQRGGLFGTFESKAKRVK